MHKGITWTVGNKIWCLHFYNYAEAKQFFLKEKTKDSKLRIYYRGE